MTVTLIAGVDSDPSTPTRLHRPDRADIGAAYGTATPVRVRRPPVSEPPYDSAFPSLVTTTRATPATAAAPAATRPSRPAPQPSSFAASRGPIGTPPCVPATSMAVVPPVAASAQRYVRICLEVLNGFRPASHLRTLGGPVEFSMVVSQLGRRRNGRGHFTQTAESAPTAGGPSNRHVSRPGSAGARNAGTTPTAGQTSFTPTHAVPARPGGAGTARRNAPGAAQPFRLLRMRLSEPRDGVAEIVAVLSYAGSSLAMALRLERHGDQWLCALVQVI